MRPLAFEWNRSFFGEFLIAPVPAVAHGTTTFERCGSPFAAIPPATGFLGGVFGFAGDALHHQRLSQLATRCRIPDDDIDSAFVALNTSYHGA
jgi:hypothetical protein